VKNHENTVGCEKLLDTTLKTSCGEMGKCFYSVLRRKRSPLQSMYRARDTFHIPTRDAYHVINIIDLKNLAEIFLCLLCLYSNGQIVNGHSLQQNISRHFSKYHQWRHLHALSCISMMLLCAVSLTTSTQFTLSTELLSIHPYCMQLCTICGHSKTFSCQYIRNQLSTGRKLRSTFLAWVLGSEGVADSLFLLVSAA